MVFVLDKHKRPLMPCTEKRARLLLSRKRAVVHKMSPFTIRLKGRTLEQSVLQPLRLKFNPGSKGTGFAVLREDEPDTTKAEAILLGEIRHKPGIKSKLDSRRNSRRSRRNRKTRYRQPRFSNRTRRDSWLPPSLNARVDQTMSAAGKLLKLLPVTGISTEHAKFDAQLMQNPNISGVEYQQGDLSGYEVREYLLEKWHRRCAYCGKENVPLQIDHVVPRSKGGTDRISNLTLSCQECNLAKNATLPAEWLNALLLSADPLDKKRAASIPAVLKKLKEPLRDAAMLNATRWRLFNRLKETGLPIECGTGARTKKQRLEQQLPKTHYYDACCVGASTPQALVIASDYVSIWSAKGRGSRKICTVNKHGFPRSHRSGRKFHFGFQTGDLVTALIHSGKYAGRHAGRVLVRANGYFDIKDSAGTRICQGISWRHMRLLQRNPGWQYEKQRAA